MKAPKAHGRPPVNAFSAALEYPTTRCNSHTPSSPRMRPSRTKFSAKPPCCQRKAWRRLLTFFFSLARADYLNKGASGVCDQIRSVESRLPFALQGFDCDNGSEFLNFHLQRYFSDRPREIAFTRSRPYKKNDNAHAARARGNWNNNRCPSATQRCGRYRNYAPDSTSRMAAAISGSEKSKIGRPSSPLAYWPIRS